MLMFFLSDDFRKHADVATEHNKRGAFDRLRPGQGDERLCAVSATHCAIAARTCRPRAAFLGCEGLH